MKLLADKHIYFLEDLLPEEVELFYYDSQHGYPELEGMDAWILRTVTKVNAKTIPHLPSSLKYIGSASAGFDHVDLAFLASKNIGFEYSPGCNAQAVAEYVVTGIISWVEHMQIDITSVRVGIIGMGHTGSAVAKLLDRIGVSYLAYDPPKSLKESSFYTCTKEALAECEILSLHVPLIKDQGHSTYHLIPDILSISPKNRLVINASRGGVVNESYLLEDNILNRISKKEFSYIIDVWEDEPKPNPDVVKHAFLASPHIAGYSKEAKFEATRAVLTKILKHFNLSVRSYGNTHSNNHSVEESGHPLDQSSDSAKFESSNPLHISKLHGLHNYNYEIRKLSERHDIINSDEYGRLFQELRNRLPLRKEFNKTTLPADSTTPYSVLFSNSSESK